MSIPRCGIPESSRTTENGLHHTRPVLHRIGILASHETPSKSEPRDTLASRNRKRPRIGSIEEDGEDEGEDDGSPPTLPGKKVKLLMKESACLSFACPYAKQNPWKHQECLGLKLGKFSYAKQHLIRAHSAVTYCPRCGREFPGEDPASEFNKHLSQEYVCEIRAFSLDGKMTSEIRSKVLDAKRRKDAKGQKLSDEERWFRVYGILFPDATPPKSPYAESPGVEILQAFSASMSQEIGSKVLGQIGTHGLPREVCIRLVEDAATAFAQYIMYEGNKLSPGTRDLSPICRGISSQLENSPTLARASLPPEIRSTECSLAQESSLCASGYTILPSVLELPRELDFDTAYAPREESWSSASAYLPLSNRHTWPGPSTGAWTCEGGRLDSSC